MPRTLNITNGDSAVATLRAGGVPGEIIGWRDVLHDGPVPALPWNELRDVRAGFIASRGWGARHEVLADFTRRDTALLEALDRHADVVLWFEHDLYDQLQLIQVLAMAAPAMRDGAVVRLAPADEYIGEMGPDDVHALARRVRPISDEELSVALEAWDAFTADGLTRLERFAQSTVEGEDDDESLPYLRPAMQRLLQEVPNAVTGLSRTELQALRTLAESPRTRGDLYVAAHHEAESPIWLGDASFFALLDELCAGGRPLVEREGKLLRLTADGHAVLEGRLNRVELGHYDRWIGGTHLMSGITP